MAADFNKPTVASDYAAFPGEIRDNVAAAVTMHETDASSNKPTGAKQITAAGVIKRWNGSAWVELADPAGHAANTLNPHATNAAQAGALAIANNLSDLSDAAAARGNLGLSSTSVAGGYLGDDYLGVTTLGI
jgi:hypothetical protein